MRRIALAEKTAERRCGRRLRLARARLAEARGQAASARSRLEALRLRLGEEADRLRAALRDGRIDGAREYQKNIAELAAAFHAEDRRIATVRSRVGRWRLAIQRLEEARTDRA